jgi:hypothetical protein
MGNRIEAQNALSGAGNGNLFVHQRRERFATRETQ